MDDRTRAYTAVVTPDSEKNRDHGNVLLIILIVLFGQGSWIALNGIWVELPLLVSLGVPEGFALATWLVLIIQVANVGPLAFTLANYLTPSGLHLEIYVNYVITTFAALVAFLLIFVWDNYSVWGFTGDSDALHSTALLVCAFLLSMVDCTSSVAFTPFMARYRSIYVNWYFVGEGFSALLPSIVALIQGVSSNAECRANHTITFGNDTHVTSCSSWVPVQRPARFSPDGFFAFLSAMALTCFLSYVLLNVLPSARQERTQNPTNYREHDQDQNAATNEYKMVTDHDTSDRGGVAVVEISKLKKRPKRLQFYFGIFGVLGVVNALNNAVLPSVQSYSAGAYGLTTYLVAATLSCVSKPVASLLVLLRPKRNPWIVGGISVAGTLIGGYCLMAGFMSPSPPLQHTAVGRVLIVSAWVLATGCFAYVHATVGWILRQEPDSRTLLIWFGGITQLGSLIGACTMFAIVNATNTLVPYYEDPCQDLPMCETVKVS